MMTNLSATIDGILGRQDRTLGELAKSAGLPPSALSKLRKGGGASNDVLRRLVEHISPERLLKGELLKSHLMDEIGRAQIDHRLVRIQPGPGTPQTADHLPPEIHRAIGQISQAIAAGAHEFQNIVLELAELASRYHGGAAQPVPQAAEDPAAYPAPPPAAPPSKKKRLTTRLKRNKSEPQQTQEGQSHHP
jgi:hypothetical protein